MHILIDIYTLYTNCFIEKLNCKIFDVVILAMYTIASNEG